mmetsp:Transcript_8051/g.21445  ORF Transcript_8051/g.21445 Transcript_8051/m.21445 type:complete len:249 (+) Transcript_8051:55-801(+)
MQYHDEEAPLIGGGGPQKRSLTPSYEFGETIVRQGFIRRVFGLLALQLALTAGVSAAFIYSPPVRGFVASNPWTLWTALGGSLVLVLLLSFSQTARRKHPWNMLSLFAFTACEALLVGTVCATYQANVVLLAVGVTAATVSALALFALNTKMDLTMMGGSLLGLLFTLLFASILQAFIHVSWLQWAISVGGATLFSAYLVFDIQLLMGEGAVSISPDEYVFGALTLYLDVLNLFLYLLQIINEFTRDR